ncbi:MAG TPA: ABC transporter permease subunit [Desulfitobacteriaceae bacterium]|nr:ABC transporter permease subunit [Desulfitobacteriaceae bacterium]
MAQNQVELFSEKGQIQAEIDKSRNDLVTPKLRFLAFLPLITIILDFCLHLFLPNKQLSGINRSFDTVLVVAWVVYAILLLLSFKFKNIINKLNHSAPLLLAITILVEIWDLVTLKFNLLPLPYFPGPDKVLGVFVIDWGLILTSTVYSLRLLAVAYIIGVTIGLITGIAMGWNKTIYYWVMPVLKVIGPIPATAWIPIAMVAFPTSFWASIFLIVLSVWFPVTVMTSSGIAGVQNSFFDVARTLGADEKFLIFRVAIPAAFPSIFIGLFMGMCNSFLTLIVGEMLGVKAGLGWYINWAQGWAEYSKVYAALIVIAFIFSSLLTLLFKFKDRVLSWQKGLIKW